MLELPSELLREVVRACEEAYPNEACGLLAGRTDGERRTVRRVFPTRNAEPHRPSERFIVHPVDLMDAADDAREGGDSLVGVFHSHPDRPARPSRRDLEMALDGWSYVIVSLRGEGERVRAGEKRSWTLSPLSRQPAFTEEPLVGGGA